MGGIGEPTELFKPVKKKRVNPRVKEHPNHLLNKGGGQEGRET